MDSVQLADRAFFDTAQVAPAGRGAYWKQAIAYCCYSMDMQLGNSATFDAKLGVWKKNRSEESDGKPPGWTMTPMLSRKKLKMTSTSKSPFTRTVRSVPECLPIWSNI